MRLHLFVKLKYESNTIIFVGRYSLRDLLFGLINYAWPANWRYASVRYSKDVSASSGISAP